MQSRSLSEDTEENREISQDRRSYTGIPNRQHVIVKRLPPDDATFLAYDAVRICM
jgi:hypothetical protein